MSNDLALRLAITAVFCVSIAECSYVLVAQHDQWKSIVSNLLHLVTSVAMIVMVWSRGVDLPTAEPLTFFLLAAIWFVGMVVTNPSGIRERLKNGYHAVMMTAMAWMYAVMNGDLLATHHSGHSHARDVHASGMHTPSAMDMSSTDMQSKASELPWITTINWIATLGFAVAALYWLLRFLADRPTSPVPHNAPPAHRELRCQAFMAAGMAITFGVAL